MNKEATSGIDDQGEERTQQLNENYKKSGLQRKSTQKYQSRKVNHSKDQIVEIYPSIQNLSNFEIGSSQVVIDYPNQSKDENNKTKDFSPIKVIGQEKNGIFQFNNNSPSIFQNISSSFLKTAAQSPIDKSKGILVRGVLQPLQGKQIQRNKTIKNNLHATDIEEGTVLRHGETVIGNIRVKVPDSIQANELAPFSFSQKDDTSSSAQIRHMNSSVQFINKGVQYSDQNSQTIPESPDLQSNCSFKPSEKFYRNQMSNIQMLRIQSTLKNIVDMKEASTPLFNQETMKKSMGSASFESERDDDADEEVKIADSQKEKEQINQLLGIIEVGGNKDLGDTENIDHQIGFDSFGEIAATYQFQKKPKPGNKGTQIIKDLLRLEVNSQEPQREFSLESHSLKLPPSPKPLIVISSPKRSEEIHHDAFNTSDLSSQNHFMQQFAQQLSSESIKQNTKSFVFDLSGMDVSHLSTHDRRKLNYRRKTVSSEVDSSNGQYGFYNLQSLGGTQTDKLKKRRASNQIANLNSLARKHSKLQARRSFSINERKKEEKIRITSQERDSLIQLEKMFDQISRTSITLKLSEQLSNIKEDKGTEQAQKQVNNAMNQDSQLRKDRNVVKKDIEEELVHSPSQILTITSSNESEVDYQNLLNKYREDFKIQIIQVDEKSDKNSLYQRYKSVAGVDMQASDFSEEEFKIIKDALLHCNTIVEVPEEDLKSSIGHSENGEKVLAGNNIQKSVFSSQATQKILTKNLTIKRPSAVSMPSLANQTDIQRQQSSNLNSSNILNNELSTGNLALQRRTSVDQTFLKQTNIFEQSNEAGESKIDITSKGDSQLASQVSMKPEQLTNVINQLSHQASLLLNESPQKQQVQPQNFDFLTKVSKMLDAKKLSSSTEDANLQVSDSANKNLQPSTPDKVKFRSKSPMIIDSRDSCNNYQFNHSSKKVPGRNLIKQVKKLVQSTERLEKLPILVTKARVNNLKNQLKKQLVVVGPNKEIISSDQDFTTKTQRKSKILRQRQAFQLLNNSLSEMPSPSQSNYTKGDLFITVDQEPWSFDQGIQGYRLEGDFSPCSYNSFIKDSNSQFQFFEKSQSCSDYNDETSTYRYRNFNPDDFQYEFKNVVRMSDNSIHDMTGTSKDQQSMVHQSYDSSSMRQSYYSPSYIQNRSNSYYKNYMPQNFQGGMIYSGIMQPKTNQFAPNTPQNIYSFGQTYSKGEGLSSFNSSSNKKQPQSSQNSQRSKALNS